LFFWFFFGFWNDTNEKNKNEKKSLKRGEKKQNKTKQNKPTKGESMKNCQPKPNLKYLSTCPYVSDVWLEPICIM
jgi:hypothetical protein